MTSTLSPATVRNAPGGAAAVPMVTASGHLPVIVTIFLIGLIFPVFISAGPLRLSIYRIILLLALVPGLIRWLGGRAGSVRPTDFCILLIPVWGAVSWMVLHGAAAAVEPVGVLFVETVGAYFLGRSFIRTPEAFRRMALWMFWIVVALLPTLFYEMATGRSPLLTLLQSAGETYAEATAEPRLGFERAQGPFQHPILLGVFCGAGLSLAYYVVAEGRAFITRAMCAGTVIAATFSALSSGPLGGLGVQCMMIGWDGAFRNFRHRWWGFAGFGAAMYILLDLLSNRTPIVVIFSYLAFNPNTARGRLQTFEWGWQDVLEHPVLGNILGDWERPEWLTPSVDMFWLSRAMAHGMPMGALYLLAVFAVFFAVSNRRFTDPRLRSYRMGYLGTMVGMFAAGWAVHFWNEPYVLLMFLMGSGVWLLDHPDQTAPSEPQPADRRRPRVVIGELRAKRD